MSPRYLFVFLCYAAREMILEIETLNENCINVLLSIKET